MRIEVGQGLEGAIPDITAKRIISDQVIPLFRAKRFSAGVVVGVHEILRLADKEFANENHLEEKSKGNIPSFLVIIILIVLVVLGPLRRRPWSLLRWRRRRMGRWWFWWRQFRRRRRRLVRRRRWLQRWRLFRQLVVCTEIFF